MLREEEKDRYDEEVKQFGSSRLQPRTAFSKPEVLKELLKRGLLMNGKFEHDQEVTSIDVHDGLKLIASGDRSGLIKIWNYKRQLIREV